MTIARAATAGTVINRAAVEIGLAAVVDPYSSNDPSFKQLAALLNTAGEELAGSFQWEFLTRSHQQLTLDTDSGNYPLPEDFLYMIPQTGWEHTNRVPLFGALSAQDWTYLKGRKLASETIYASFRIQQGEFTIFPQPPPNGLDINFEYQTKNWVIDPETDLGKDEANKTSDLVLFDKILISRYLKVKYMEAKGLDTTKAQDDFQQQFAFITNVDKPAEVLNAGGRGRAFPYLDTYRNTPDTGYGGGGYP